MNTKTSVLASKITLRQATADDAATVTTVLLTSRAHHLPYARSPRTASELRAWVQDVLLPAGRVTLAMAEDHAVGVLAISQVDGTGWIDQLYLLPEVTGRGIGGMLLDFALATLARPVRLYTFQQNLGAQRFFEAAGFQPIEFSDGSANEEQCPDILYELS